jgi:uncharacterized OB-fold protein
LRRSEEGIAVALIERLQKSPDTTFWPGKIPLKYIYTAGRAGEEFFKRLREKGEFIGARCEDCDTVYFPPRIYCEQCFKRIEGNWLPLQNRGVVHTLTVCHEAYDEKPKKELSIVAFIRFEETDGGMMHWLSEVEAQDCYIGMAVEAVLKPVDQREGSILDITHFRPL